MKRLLYSCFFLYLSWALQGQSNADYCWTAQGSILPVYHLWDVQFLDDQHGWAASNGVIFATTDGGNSWQQQTIVGWNHGLIFGIHMLDAQTGWAAGELRGVYQTQNGGAGGWQSKTMVVSPNPPEPWLTDVYFTDKNTGWVVGIMSNNGNTGEIYKTRDGGQTWERQISGVKSNDGGYLWDIQMVDSLTGWAVGDYGSIVATTDGGTNWQLQSSGTVRAFRDLFFLDKQQGWVVGDGGIILHTADGGISWQPQPSGVSGTLRSVFFVDNQTGWAAGNQGVILNTADGGASWQKVNSGTGEDLYGLSFTGAQTGWAVGWHGTVLKYGAVPAPAAAFDWTASGKDIQFNNLSTGAVYSFWEFGDGKNSEETNPFHNYATPGIYTVKLTVANACGTVTVFETAITVTTTKVSGPESLGVFDVYPNPATGFFTVALNGAPRPELFLDLFDNTGRKVMNTSLDFQSGTSFRKFSAADYAPGIYWLRVSDDRGSALRQIILK